MRIIVPLQGLLQGRSGLALGVILPLLSFYFIQLRPKRSQQRLNNTAADTTTKLPPAASARASPPAPAAPAHPAPVVVTSANSNSQDSPNNSNTTSVPKEHSETVTPEASETLKLLLLHPQHSEASTTTIVQEAALSERALWVLRSCNSEWIAIPENAYDGMRNPTGCIQLAVATNKLSLNLIQDWLCDHLSTAPGHETYPNLEEAADYESQCGLQRVRTVVANFMGIVMGCEQVMFDPANVIITAGPSAAIEMLVFCLAQPGDAILIPTPYDSGFDKDIKWRTQVEIIPVPCGAHNNFSVTKGDLEIAYHSALQRGMTVRAVLLSTPSYPVGNVLDHIMLQSILSFVHEKSIHLISDEVYAGCVFEDSDFVSVAKILELSGEWDRSRVHIIYGLSKTLGIVGFQVGVLYSWNTHVIAAASKLTRFCIASSHTQGLLAPLLADKIFVKKFLTENQRRITQRHRKVVAAMEAVRIKFAKSTAGLCCWIFLGHCLRTSTSTISREEEMKLCTYVSQEMGVHLTPGSSSCLCHEPGWFSLCFTGVDDQTLNVALERLQKLAPGIDDQTLNVALENAFKS